MNYFDNDMLAGLVVAASAALLLGKWMLLGTFMREIRSLRFLNDSATMSASLRMDDIDTEIDKLKADIVLLKNQQRSNNESSGAQSKSKPRASGSGNRKSKSRN